MGLNQATPNIQLTGKSHHFTSVNPTLKAGEIAYETDTGFMKCGDGSTAWISLPYFYQGAGGGGTVTSVAQTVPTGFTVSGSPVTSSGTLAIAYDTGYQGYTTTEASKLSGIEALADVTDATNVDAAGATMNTDTTLAGNGYFLDEDNMASDSATKVASQQSIKAYVTNSLANQAEVIGIACSDETTDLSVATGVAEFQMPFAMTLSNVIGTVTTAPTGSTIIVDINLNGSTIATTNKLSIDATEKTSATAATAIGLTTTALTANGVITIDIDQIGSTVAGTGLKIWLIGTRT